MKQRPVLVAAAPAFVLVLALVPSRALSQGVGTEKDLKPKSADVTVTAEDLRLDPNLPTTAFSVSRKELEKAPFVNTEDALKYAPNLTIRKRYAGDRNALIGGRSSSTLQAPRGLAFVDGLLISNFLGRFNAPRWNMAAPEEISRVDVLYGPFSAIYPGNSIGTTVSIATRMPARLEGSVRVLGTSQSFKEYGIDDSYTGGQVSAWLGNKQGKLSYSLNLYRMTNTSQPMQYVTFTSPNGRPGPVADVTGAYQDLDPNGVPRIIAGANAGAIEKATQDQLKVRAAYEILPELEASAVFSLWRNDFSRRNVTFLRDASGNDVWSGNVRFDGRVYNIANGVFGPQNGEERHLQSGAVLKTKRASGWNASLVFSRYDVLTDVLRASNNPPPTGEAGGAGTVTLGDDTSWQTLEAQATWTPESLEPGLLHHQLTFGYHQNGYRLSTRVFDSSNWRGMELTAINQSYSGRTRLFAGYVQDAWKPAAKITVVAGLRLEAWRGFDGAQLISGTSPVDYGDRSRSAVSPKLSVAYQVGNPVLVRLSYGRGYRFPTVAELYQGSRSGTSIIVNDPNLRPEYSNAVEAMAQLALPTGLLRVSLFQDDVRDSIYGQSNVAAGISTSYNQNVGRVRTRGVETELVLDDLLTRGLSFSGSVALASSRTLENPALPASEGKYWVRVPKVRVAGVLSYAVSPPLLVSLAYRYSGRQYGTLDNVDINPNTYGGTSTFSVLDARAQWRISDLLTFGLSGENLTNTRYYVSHPYPQRSFSADLRAGF